MKFDRKTRERLVFSWGSAAGFVVGAALTALLYRALGWWPPNEKVLHRFAKKAARNDEQ